MKGIQPIIPMKQKPLAVLILTLLAAVSCSKDSSSGSGGTSLDCSTITNKAWTADISPVIQSSCATVVSCHGSGSVNGPGALTSYSAVFNARTIIRSAVSSGSMPQNSTLSTAQKNSILCWIDSGSPNN